jgi:hypothetical protein
MKFKEVELALSPKKNRFKSFAEHQKAIKESLGDRLNKAQVRSTVQRRTNQLAQSSENERNLIRKSKTVWDIINQSGLPPMQVMKIARAYAQQYGQQAQGTE